MEKVDSAISGSASLDWTSREGTGSAYLSSDLKYRYNLHRRWNPKGHPIVWVMLNPSTADARTDDATIRRVIGFSKLKFGAGMISVVNLFAWRATDPRELLEVEDPVGPENLAILKSTVANAEYGIVVAWGGLSPRLRRLARPSIEAVIEASKVRVMAPRCLGRTREGDPCHPVRLSYSVELHPWR